ncbi:MAG: ATP-binding protein, partial [Steroidobacteraceae bacterium]
ANPIWTSKGDDPHWRHYLSIVEQLELRSCWIHPIRTPDRNILGVLAVYRDIPGPASSHQMASLEILSGTAALVIERQQRSEEHAQSQEALRRRTEQFATLFQEAPLGVYLVDADLRIREVNPMARSIFGDIADPIGRDLDEVMHILWPRAYAEEIVGLFRHTLTSGESFLAPERIEQRRDRGVAEYYEWRINRILLPDGQWGVVCYFRDISDRVLAQQQLRQQNSELQTMLDLVPVGVAIAHDPKGDHITVNPHFAQDLRLSPAQDVSSSGPGREQIPYRCLNNGEVIPVEELPMQRAVRTGKEVRGYEYDIEWPDGRGIHLIANAAPLFNAEGKVRGAIGAHVDVTALKSAQHDLEIADRQKDEFLVMLAHELRNPIAPIRNAGELLAKSSDPAIATQAVGIIRRQTTQLARLVDDLLDISRITQGRIVLQCQVLQLAEIIGQSVEVVTPLVLEKRHRLSVTSRGAVWVEGDAARLCQCATNLLTNAAKYTDPGGAIQIESLEQGSEAVLRITDSGIGISPELLPHVFDLFVQGDRSLDRAQGGLGIGLSVVRRLVGMHHGRVFATSAGVGRGSTFEIRLPLAQAAPREPVKVSAITGPPLRIMVVDDNVDSADSLAMLLRIDGHDVRAAHSGQEALQELPAFQPDVLLLDIGLPGMDGYEVARRIRSKPELPKISLIALTGYGQAEDRQRELAAGFDGHFTKPVDLSQLQQTLALIAPRH